MALQAILLVALLSWAGWRVRDRPEWLLVVIGLALLTLGAFGLRAAH